MAASEDLKQSGVPAGTDQDGAAVDTCGHGGGGYLSATRSGKREFGSSYSCGLGAPDDRRAALAGVSGARQLGSIRRAEARGRARRTLQMTWLDLAAATAVALALVFVPGVAITMAAGLRGLWIAAVAAPAGVSVIGIAAVVAPIVGLAWSMAAVGAVAVVAALVLLALRLLVWRRQPFDADTRSRSVVTLLAVVIAAVITTTQLIFVIGSPENISQTFDNVFHLNAVRYILDHNNASPLFVASMTSAGAPPSFYPTGWHAVASLVVIVTGVSIPVASHATMLLFAAAAWPTGIILLTRTLGVHSRVGLLAAGVAAASFPAFPLLPIDYGVLFPYMMGLSLVPASLAAVLGVRFATSPAERARWLVVVLGVIPGLAIAHPGALMAFLLFAAVIAALGVVSFLRSGAGRRVKMLAGACAGVGVVVFCGLWYMVRPEAAARSWPPDETVAQAIGEVLTASPARSAHRSRSAACRRRSGRRCRSTACQDPRSRTACRSSPPHSSAWLPCAPR